MQNVPANPPASILDRFLIVVVILVAIVSAIDWLMEQSGRERLQKKVGDWWVFVETTSFGDNISRYAKFVFELYRDTFESDDDFGAKFDAFFKKLLLIFFPGIIFTAIVSARWQWINGMGPRLAPGQEGRSTHVLIGPLLLSVVVGFAGLSLARWISFSLSKGAKALLVVKVFLLSVLYVIFCLSCVILSVIVANLYEFHIRPLYTPSILRSGTDFDFKYNIMNKDVVIHLDRFINETVIAFSIGSLSLILIIVFGMQFFFIFAKLFRFALKPITSLILQRFYESKQGILTVVAVFLGGLVKLVQELTKLA